jgi:hypothetical protein
MVADDDGVTARHHMGWLNVHSHLVVHPMWTSCSTSQCSEAKSL